MAEGNVGNCVQLQERLKQARLHEIALPNDRVIFGYYCMIKRMDSLKLIEK